MVMPMLLGFAVLVALMWIVGGVADALVGHRIRVPDRWMARVHPGWLPAYARSQYARLRRGRRRT